jgi:hypothetical protein
VYQSISNRHGGIEAAQVEGTRLELAPEGRQGEDRPGKTVAKGNDDVTEMDRLAITNGELDLCLQPAGDKAKPKINMNGVDSENRPLSRHASRRQNPNYRRELHLAPARRGL